MKSNKEAAQQILLRRDVYIKVKKKRIKTFSVICISLLVTFSIYLTAFITINPKKNISDNPAEHNVSDDKKIYIPQKSGTVLDADIYSSSSNLQQLCENSHAIVIANVISTYQIDNSDIACAVIKVERTIKGNISKNDILTIEEAGKRIGENEISIAGVPLLKEKMKVLLFLTEPSDVIQGFDAYGIVDSVTGKFFYDNQEIIHPSTEFAAEPFATIEDFSASLPEEYALSIIKKALD